MTASAKKKKLVGPSVDVDDREGFWESHLQDGNGAEVSESRKALAGTARRRSLHLPPPDLLYVNSP